MDDMKIMYLVKPVVHTSREIVNTHVSTFDVFKLIDLNSPT